jgi:hypothetical protein
MGMTQDARLFIQFGPIASGGPVDTHAPVLITALDPYTGQVSALYRLAQTVESGSFLPACGISSDNFLFVGKSEDNKLKVVRYSPR